MSKQSEDINLEDQVPEHVRRTLEAMASSNREAAALLKRVHDIADRLSRLDPAIGNSPAERESKKDELAGHGATGQPSSEPAPERTKLPPEVMNLDHAYTDRLVQKTVELVMDKIQPLLAALEKVRTEQSKPQQLTETEYVTKMCEEMRQRVARRRGFAPRISREEGQS